MILGSGLTIAGAMFCLHFTRLPDVPVAGRSAVHRDGGRGRGCAHARARRGHGRQLPRCAGAQAGHARSGSGVASVPRIVRWPGPILVATLALCLIGLLALPGYRTDYNDRHYLPSDIPAAQGFAAAERHFPAARLSPELLMLESDHDLRNSADFLVIDRSPSRSSTNPASGGCRPSPGRWAPRSSTVPSRSCSACRAPCRR